jgi:hypothetical protein
MERVGGGGRLHGLVAVYPFTPAAVPMGRSHACSCARAVRCHHHHARTRPDGPRDRTGSVVLGFPRASPLKPLTLDVPQQGRQRLASSSRQCASCEAGALDLAHLLHPSQLKLGRLALRSVSQWGVLGRKRAAHPFSQPTA